MTSPQLSTRPFPSTGAEAAAATHDDERLERLERRVDEIHALLTRSAPFCEKMGEHISFVECVMKRIRFPAWLFPVEFHGARAIPDAAGAGDAKAGSSRRRPEDDERAFFDAASD